MSERESLKEELKQDAKKAWDYVKQGAKKVGTYVLLTLSLASNTGAGQLNKLEQDHQHLQETHTKLDKKLANRFNSPLIYDGFMKGFVEVTPEEKATKAYETLMQDQVVAKELSFSELMEKTGITKEDIQSVFSKNQDRLKDLIPGEIGSALAKSADKVTGKNNEGCLLGAQKICGKTAYAPSAKGKRMT